MGNFQGKHLGEQSSLQMATLQSDTLSEGSEDNFVDIETNEESHLEKDTFRELQDSSEASFSLCKNPFSQWFL